MIIVDYKVGNIGSIINMLKKIGIKSKLSCDPQEILAADRLLLPGVGSFDHGMKSLKESGLVDILNRKVLKDKVPVLGICLGMQLLMDGSEEGSEEGLGWIKGQSKRFVFDSNKENLKVPHMGWNIACPRNKNTIFRGFDDEARFYFVHSYHAVCEDESNILATTHFGYDFASSIVKENIFGAQFHPEKSHHFGMQLLKNFSEFSSC